MSTSRPEIVRSTVISQNGTSRSLRGIHIDEIGVNRDLAMLRSRMLMFKISGILLTFIPVAFPLAFSQRLLRKCNEAPKGVHLLLAAHTLFE
jgi:hypothetical protein